MGVGVAEMLLSEVLKEGMAWTVSHPTAENCSIMLWPHRFKSYCTLCVILCSPLFPGFIF